MMRNFVPSTWLKTVGRMLSAEPAAVAAHDHLVREEIRGRLDRRGVPDRADPAGKRGRAEPVGSAADRRRCWHAHQRLAREVAREGSDHGAVARRLPIDVVGRDDARRLRHVLDDDGRLPGDMFRQESGEEAGADVVVVADRVTDDQAQLLVLVEIRPRLAAGGDASRRRARLRRHNVHGLVVMQILPTLTDIGATTARAPDRDHAVDRIGAAAAQRDRERQHPPHQHVFIALGAPAVAVAANTG